MSQGTESGIPLQLSQECVVASIQVDLGHDVLLGFRQELLRMLQISGARGIILDLSGVSVMDSEDFLALRHTMEMARLMGAVTVMSGLQPGVVSSLIDLDANTDGVEARLTLDDAFEYMTELRMQRTSLAEEDGLEDEESEGEGSQEEESEEPGEWDSETDEP
jgi:rsbT antagonist protein RsbS